MQLPKIAEACKIQTSEDEKVRRVFQCHTNNENFLNIEGLYPDTGTLNFRPNSSVIKTLPTNLFEKFSNIETLVMNDVHLEELQKRIFLDAKHLKILSFERNRLTRLRENTFSGATLLDTIKLGKNNISSIEPETFNGLENLRILDLSRNDLHLLLENTFEGLTSLEEIDLSFNHLETLPKHIFSSSHLIKVVKIFKNNLKTFEINLPNDRNFCYLNVDNNSINYFSLTFTQLTASDDDTQTDCTTYGIHAENNAIDHFYVTKESMAVNLFVLNNNRLNNIENVTQITALTKLDLSNNPRLTDEDLIELKNAKKIQGLTLKQLNLTRLDIDIFSHFGQLTELDVSNNLLEEVDFAAFSDGLSDFYKLNLANNQITSLNVDKLLEKFPNISYLNIRGNRLTRNHLNDILAALNGKSITVIQ